MYLIWGCLMWTLEELESAFDVVLAADVIYPTTGGSLPLLLKTLSLSISHKGWPCNGMCKRLALLPGGFFPECVARVPVSLIHSGGLGLRVCSLDVAFTFATVFVWGPYGRAYGEFCKRGHFWTFWRFQALRSLVSRGRRGTLWHSNTFHNVSKVVLCGRRDTFATFSHDELHFSWQAQHFGDLHRYFDWQAQHFRRVMLRVYCELPLSGLRQVVFNVQNPWQEWHFVRCAENCWKPRMKHRFWASWV